MSVRRFVCVLMVALVGGASLLLTACGGGSGSSGFDAGLAAENAAIQRTLAAQQCEMHEGLTICPAHEGPGGIPVTPGMPASATPTPATPAVDTLVDRQTPIACVRADAQSCQFTLTFVPQGFPATTTFRVAVRNVGPNSVWRITPEAMPINAPNPAGGLVTTVDAAAGAAEAAQPGRVQLAVLVFLTPPAALPDTVSELVDSGADFAFVTGELPLLPSV